VLRYLAVTPIAWPSQPSPNLVCGRGGTFRWRDSAHKQRKKPLPLSVDEFLRRFLLHLLPKVSCAIRTSAFLANRKRASRFATLFQLLVPHHRPSKRSHRQSQRSLHLPQMRWSMVVIERFTQLKSNSVLPRLRCRCCMHPIYITKLSVLSARYLSLCFLSNQSFSPLPKSSLPTTFQLSATLLSLWLGAVLFCVSPDASQNLLFLN